MDGLDVMKRGFFGEGRGEISGRDIYSSGYCIGGEVCYIERGCEDTVLLEYTKMIYDKPCDLYVLSR